MKKILSIDGGGVRGIIPAAMLDQLGLSVADFDLIAGTSSGAITAGLLAIGHTPREVVTFYRNEAKNIFTGRRWGLFRSRYSARSLDETLAHYFWGYRLDSLSIPLVLPAYDIEEGRPMVFTSAKDWPLAYAVRASVSAPTYFPPADNRYIDGGLWANNPSLIALAEAKVRWPGEPCWVLSLGTGAAKKHVLQLKDSGLFGWGPNIVDVLLTASADSTDAILQVANLTRTEGRPLYDRVQVVLPEATGLDDVSSLGMLEELGREAIRHRLDTGYNLPTKPM